MAKRALGCFTEKVRAVVRNGGMENGSCIVGGMVMLGIVPRQSMKRSQLSRWGSLAAIAWPAKYSSALLRMTPDLYTMCEVLLVIGDFSDRRA